MARVELIMPKMGESVSEATIITWSKEIGDNIEMDETIVEIATDKVDSEVPSTHEGKLVEMLFAADDVVQVGEPFVIFYVNKTNNFKFAIYGPKIVKLRSFVFFQLLNNFFFILLFSDAINVE